ncbi:MAG: hypothetical protein K2X87_21945 [Gemmataceae bacterium]|nr:hypothetical protein [Gemmataceae bacterium]
MVRRPLGTLLTALGVAIAATGMAVVLAGCGGGSPQPQAAAPAPEAGPPTGPDAEVAAALAELPPEDRRLAEEQKFCPVMPDTRLGEMGAPIKLEVKGQPVFVCCKGCRKKALADPDKTLAKVAELKAARAAESRTGK